MSARDGQAERYSVRPDGSYTVRDFTRAKPFSSFLPGIAGLWGVPLWVYYVNRGQAIACFGTGDKDHPILEFTSAAHGWSRTQLEGFRTFLLFDRGGQASFYEPFRDDPPEGVENRLRVTRSGLELEERSARDGLSVRVEYLTLSNRPVAALGRRVTVENTGGEAARVRLLDGLARMQPYGVTFDGLTVMPFITRSYLRVRGLDERLVMLNVKARSSDVAATEFVEEVNFYAGALRAGGPPERMRPVVDPALVFGEGRSLERPRVWLETAGVDPVIDQATHCTTPTGMVEGVVDLAPGETATVTSWYGSAPSPKVARQTVEPLESDGAFDRAKAESDAEVRKVSDRCFIASGDPILDAYAAGTYLENSLRGGVPVSLEAASGRAVLHVFSRKHGDMERDYNFFSLEPRYFSQGNGNYRDVNQNRRDDAWFNPDVGTDNLRYFVNLIQPDGFNPLICEGVAFRADPERVDDVLLECVGPDHRPRLAERLARPFTPGELFAFIERKGVALAVEKTALLSQLVAISDRVERASHGHGYWTDHWFYNIDLLESFLAIFPERLRETLVEDRTFVYRDTAWRVLPRDERFVLLEPGKVRQVHSTAHDAAKAELIARRTDRPHAVRTDRGEGVVYHTNLLGKLVCLLVGKLASISPSGVGLDMEGGRPGWHDSINGLPSQFGATTSETYQLLRLIRLLRDALDEMDLGDEWRLSLPVEVLSFYRTVDAALRKRLAGTGGDPDLAYWRQTAEAKQAYRDAVWLGFDGAEGAVEADDLRGFLSRGEARIEASLPKVNDPQTGLPATYVIHEATRFETICGPGGDETTDAEGRPFVRVLAFDMKRLPLFLEAPMHRMRIEHDPDRARKSLAAVRESPLYDRELGMYLVNAPIPEELDEIGRIWAWPPGWFERTNVFLHLEHKFLLSMLAAGLAEEFFEDLQRCLIPRQAPEVYGRNPLENASFIVSSRHPRATHHGRGFLPRTSGTTAEVLSMLLWMSFGRRPFVGNPDGISLRFAPVLPDWIFTSARRTAAWMDPEGKTHELDLPENSYTALFLGHTLVTYVNPERRPTFGPDAVRPVAYRLYYPGGRERTVVGSALADPEARDVRDGKMTRIEVTLDEA